MHFLEYYSKSVVKYDLINKFRFETSTKLPDIKFINLRFNFKKFEVKSLMSALIALELITNQKATFITSKKFNVSLKLQKGDPIGCKIVLRKLKMRQFLYQLLNKMELIKKMETLNSNKLSLYSFKIKNVLIFNSLEKNYKFFKNLRDLHIGIGTSNLKFNNFKFLLQSYKIIV